ncbi:MAG TPA: glycosyltransferase family 4 protein [Candidatus Saccharimonadales bacterium]|jgi:glycosyltransferase involved in cell wall biosynthesis|nr:glycosyltransferase family 4 protein [Candidatus Saccharimonadales bacterium]
MRAAIHNPYLDTLGGGERYTAVFAQVLLKNGYLVDLEWKDPEIKKTLEQRFGINLDGLNIVDDVKKGDGYDLCFWVSDGSIPLLHARNNILHFQVPFHGVAGRSLLNRMKLIRINKIVCNSQFTKKTVDKEYGVEGVVIYPPVDTLGIKPKRKENMILYVGRFSRILQSKGQEVLVKSFEKMFDSGLKDWKLVLAGGTEVGAGNYVNELRKTVSGYPIDIFENLDFKKLKDLYGKAKIFWSASGYGVNENKNPEKVEHFGITVVEAMAGGTVPVIYSAGGHTEIVVTNENGFLWDNPAKLINKTQDLVNDPSMLRKLALNARESSTKYSLAGFEKGVISYILQK